MKKTFMKLTSALFLAVMALWSVDAQAGCNDATACNYVSTDTDAVDCLFYTISVGGGSFESEMSWDIEDGTGTVIYSGFAPETVCADFPDDCYTLNLYDSFGDGWNGGTMIITEKGGWVR